MHTKLITSVKIPNFKCRYSESKNYSTKWLIRTDHFSYFINKELKMMCAIFVITLYKVMIIKKDWIFLKFTVKEKMQAKKTREKYKLNFHLSSIYCVLSIVIVYRQFTKTLKTIPKYVGILLLCSQNGNGGWQSLRNLSFFFL